MELGAAINQQDGIDVQRSSPGVVISVREVGKMYRLYDRPQDRLKEQLFWRFGKHFGREFWALQDVSFEIHRGEAVGIVGRNGSGKSTLLQVIAGTLTPTTGEISVKGRLAALLELGSGFNPEFTGRENVFLNGAILGIGNEEMEGKYGDIVEFADIGQFIDQPVKLYSSGMVVRLAFAVQAVVEKDILLVDEALAVGDEAFQRKCMRALEQFREAGGTVLFVSHNAQAIVRHCSRCLFLNEGRLVLDGPSKPILDIYQRIIFSAPKQQEKDFRTIREHGSESVDVILGLITVPNEHQLSAVERKPNSPAGGYDVSVPKGMELSYGTGQATITDFGMYDETGQLVNVLVAGGTYSWRYVVTFGETAWNVKFGMMFKTIDGIEVANINTIGERQYIEKIDEGSAILVCVRLRVNLAPGIYFLNSGVMGDTFSGSGYLHRRVDLYSVRVIPPDERSIYGIAYLEPHLEVAQTSSIRE